MTTCSLKAPLSHSDCTTSCSHLTGWGPSQCDLLMGTASCQRSLVSLNL